MSTIAAYQEDLAYIHDVGFDFYARGVAPELLKILRRHGIRKGLVVDLGCGSGIWARELTDAGYEVLGVDISGAMIRLARKKRPRPSSSGHPISMFNFLLAMWSPLWASVSATCSIRRTA